MLHVRLSRLAHPYTHVLLFPDHPRSLPLKLLPDTGAETDLEAANQRCGWCYYTHCTAALVKQGWCLWDVSKYKGGASYTKCCKEMKAKTRTPCARRNALDPLTIPRACVWLSD